MTRRLNLIDTATRPWVVRAPQPTDAAAVESLLGLRRRIHGHVSSSGGRHRVKLRRRLRALAGLDLPLDGSEAERCGWNDLLETLNCGDCAADRVPQAVLNSYDFSAFARVVDIGGHHGLLLARLLQRYPAVQGVLLHSPSVVASARCQLNLAGVSDRCTVLVGEMSEGVPLGGDAYLLSRVIHRLDDATSLRVLGNCGRAIAGRGRLLLIERIQPSLFGSEASDRFFDDNLAELNLLLRKHARERTEAQYAALLAVAGLTITNIVPTSAPPIHVIEAASTWTKSTTSYAG